MNVGTLTIEINANVARLQADMEATKRSVQGAMKDVEQYVGFAKTAFVALTGVAGVSAFAGMISSSISAKARLADLSLQTGMSVESLASLQRIGQFSSTSLDSIAGASNKLSKALATSNEDSKGAALAIEALGLNFDAFKQLKAEDQMLTVAKAMDGFKDSTNKSAAAMLLYGKQGAELLPFMRELVERQGLLGDTTTATAKAAKDYEDNIVALRRESDKWKQQIVNDLLPGLTALTGQLVAAKTGGEKFAVILGSIRDNVSFSRFDRDRKALENMKLEIDATSARLSMYVAIGESLPDFMKHLASGGIASNRAELERLTKAAAEASELLKRNADVLSGVGGGPVDTRHLPPKPELKIEADANAREKERLRLEKELAAEAKRRAQEFAALIGPMREKIALDQMELDQGRSLTASEREALDVMVQIRDGKLQLTDARKRELAVVLEQRAAAERLNLVRKDELKALEDWRKEQERSVDAERKVLVGLEEEGRGLKQQLDDYGLTREELAKVTTARMRDAAAQLRQQALMQEFNADGLAYVSFLEREAKQLERNADMKDALARRDLEAVNRAKRERADPTAGAMRAVKEYRDELERVGDATAQVVGGSLRGLEDGLTDLFTKGKWDARSFIDTLIREFTRLSAVQPMMKSLLGGGGGASGLAGLFGGGSQLGTLFGGGSSTGGFGFGTGTGFGNLDLGGFFARGGVFDGGAVQAFARGGIVEQPTLFNFANGGAMRNGLMAENEPEAVMPLTRGRDGRLGVAASGSGGHAVTVVQHVTIGAGVSPSQLAQGMAQAKEQAKAEIADQLRRGSRAFQ
jgi:lambda family phage tail tape measure protein